MEKKFHWESESGIWQVKARVIIDDVFFSDSDVYRLNKQNGRFERMSSAKTYTKEVEAAREEARNFIRTERALYIELRKFEQEFERIKVKGGNKRDRMLADLMTEMESRYKISMIKERFERETHPVVRRLYLAVSAAREL